MITRVCIPDDASSLFKIGNQESILLNQYTMAGKGCVRVVLASLGLGKVEGWEKILRGWRDDAVACLRRYYVDTLILSRFYLRACISSRLLAPASLR